MDSILTSIKKLLGIAETYTHFDTDIIIHINSALFRLRTLGVGPTEDGVEANALLNPKPFKIEDKTKTWSDLIGDRDDLESIKTYVYLRVKMIFDPPQTSFTIKSYENRISELEWFIKEQAGGDLDE